MGDYDSRMDGAIQEHLSSVTNLIQRPLTHDEASSIASYLHKTNNYASISLPLGLCGGVYQAVKTWKTYGFPFVGSLKSENGWFNGERIRLMGFEIPGRRARILVHSLRLSTYGLLGFLFSSLAIGSCWAVVVGGQEARDPKLEKLRQDVKNARVVRMEAARAEFQKEWRRAETSPVVLWQKQKRATGRPTKGAKEEEAVEEAAFTGDDASPTAEGFETEEFGTRGSEEEEEEDGHHANTTYSPTKDHKPPPVQQRPTPSSFSKPSRPMGQDPSNPTTPPRNAWDRIRREASSRSPSNFPSTTPQNRRAQPSRGEDDDGSSNEYSYPQEEEEKAYAKGEAQREFDEMVERERRGSGDEEAFTAEDVVDANADGNGAGAGSGWKRERKRRAL